MSRELWKKCVKTDYSNASARDWIEKYTPELLPHTLEMEDLGNLYHAINILEGLKLKYKPTENNCEGLPLVALGPLSCLLGTN